MSSDVLRALDDIASRDPDGGEVEPTEAAHAAHEAWAVGLYGVEVWERYSKGGWNQPDW